MSGVVMLLSGCANNVGSMVAELEDRLTMIADHGWRKGDVWRAQAVARWLPGNPRLRSALLASLGGKLRDVLDNLGPSIDFGNLGPTDAAADFRTGADARRQELLAVRELIILYKMTGHERYAQTLRRIGPRWSLEAILSGVPAITRAALMDTLGDAALPPAQNSRTD